MKYFIPFMGQMAWIVKLSASILLFRVFIFNSFHQISWCFLTRKLGSNNAGMIKITLLLH